MRWTVIVALVSCVAIGIIIAIVLKRAEPILKGRIEETIAARTGGRATLDSLHVSLLRGLQISGEGLRIYSGVADNTQARPLIAVAHFSFRSGVIGLFFKPMHVHAVAVTGLQIEISPHNQQQLQSSRPKGKIKIAVDEILCQDSRLVIEASRPDKDPRIFELQRIELHDFGPSRPWQYKAVLKNAVPRGEIHSAGSFGPLEMNDPGSSFVSGHYTFSHADLSPIKGIGGILSSVGDFQGQLARITVDGTTETPNFSLDTANHPVPLHTRFHAIVDGTNGDTYLEPVQAKLGDSDFTVRGQVVDIKGRGHRIELDADIRDARIQDSLSLAIKTQPPVMTGTIHMKAKLGIDPGPESVTSKLHITGQFTVADIHFSNPKVEDKVDMLSLRAQGKPQEAKPGAPDVRSQIQGEVQTVTGVLQFNRLVYELPGARVDLTGRYSLDGQQFDFRGDVFTNASLRKMVASPWASALLAPISPFFKAKGGGAKIPVSITGTHGEPKFGLNLFGRDDKTKSNPQR